LINICKKALSEIEKKCRENKQNKISNSIDESLNLFETIERKELQRDAKRRSSNKETNDPASFLKDFNEGIKNLDVEVIRLVHEEEKFDSIFSKLNLDKTKIDLSGSLKSLTENC
jgi:hypothetical protein